MKKLIIAEIKKVQDEIRTLVEMADSGKVTLKNVRAISKRGTELSLKLDALVLAISLIPKREKGRKIVKHRKMK